MGFVIECGKREKNMPRIDYDDLPPPIKFIFISMLKSALDVRSLGKNKNDFIQLADEMWETMLLTPEDKMNDIIRSAMISDLKKCK
jgi:hypothetical protein